MPSATFLNIDSISKIFKIFLHHQLILPTKHYDNRIGIVLPQVATLLLHVKLFHAQKFGKDLFAQRVEHPKLICLLKMHPVSENTQWHFLGKPRASDLSATQNPKPKAQKEDFGWNLNKIGRTFFHLNAKIFSFQLWIMHPMGNVPSRVVCRHCHTRSRTTWN